MVIETLPNPPCRLVSFSKEIVKRTLVAALEMKIKLLLEFSFAFNATDFVEANTRKSKHFAIYVKTYVPTKLRCKRLV